MTYADYLRSPWWLLIRRAALRRAIWKCQRCGWGQYGGHRDGRWLEVHHLTYANVGRERPEDVTVRCNLCHADEHNRPWDLPRNVEHIGTVLPRVFDALPVEVG